MNNIRIKVPLPCKENWNCMTSTDSGRFCAVCSKVVVDFTSMTTEEVKDYFLKLRPQHICGHFKPAQIQKNYNKFQQAFIDSYNYVERTAKFRIVRLTFLFFLSLALTLLGCHNPVGTVLTNDTTLNPTLSDTLIQDTTHLDLINDTINVENKKVH
ncbi:MAG TPA: hypothetical protein PLP23_11145 [Panacibacter sp.]|nr:hypothetical protein [Panacibacter sp.]